MYPKNAASPPRISVGSIYLIADGTIQTSGASVRVRPEGGADAAGGGTLAYDTTSGAIFYTPTQAETNYTAFCATVYKASCTSSSVTVVTTASSVPGRTMPADGSIVAAVLGGDCITAAKIADDAFVAANFASSSLNGKGDWNTVVPDAAGVAAGLHGTTDGLIGTVDTVVDALAVTIGTAGDGLTAINLPNQTMDIVGNITGNLSGSVGSVTGAVGSVTGHTVQTGDTYALANGATGFVAIDTVVDAVKVVTDALTAAAAAKLALSAGTIVSGEAEAGTLSTTQMTTDLTEATDDHYNGRIIIWTSGVLQNQATDITDYSGATGLLTFTAVTEAPTATDTFIIV